MSTFRPVLFYLFFSLSIYKLFRCWWSLAIVRHWYFLARLYTPFCSLNTSH
ncbi:hypothetical protein HanPSC8_Chr04g0176211 [Helianthus annuus]|nr:hypothetical protein HanPSC8_Chr04g0176211 [Helianthus annuus]